MQGVSIINVCDRVMLSISEREYRHEFSGMYRNVLKEAKNYD